MSNKVHERGVEMEEEGSKKATRKIQELPKKILKDIWKVAKDDPRRVKHALKVGVSLTLVSLLYLLEPLFKGIGSNAMWAVLTVVVVLEFSAGNYSIFLYKFMYKDSLPVISILICCVSSYMFLMI